MPTLPASPRRLPAAVPAAAALAASGGLLFLGTGLRPLWPLAWLAPLPVLLVAPRLSAARAFAVAAVAWVAGSANLWRYLLDVLGVPIAAIALFSAVPAVVFGACVLLHRACVLRGAIARAALSLPAAWVATEAVSSWTSPHGTFGSLAYTQADLLPLVQTAAVTGIGGIAFCVLLAPSAAAAALQPRGSPRRRHAVAGAAAAIVGTVLALGAGRLARPPPPEATVVGLAATGAGTSFPREDAAALALLREYAGRASALAARGAEVVVVAEKIAVVSGGAARASDALWSPTSARGATVVVGVERRDAARRVNEARLYAPGGAPPITYAKHHLVPGWEDGIQAGDAVVAVERPRGVWGLQICKDMDFPALSRAYAALGAGLMLVPAWDFTADAWLHARMAVFRGVESGFTVARAAKQGLLTVSDDRGRILAEADAATAPEASLVVRAPVGHRDTLYARVGDAFGWLDVGLLAAILLSLARRRGARAPTAGDRSRG